MRAVWSFWSKPYLAHRHTTWPSEKHHLLSWVLSVETARQHYPDTLLVTDNAGAQLLVDGLGLQFSHVSTELNALAQHDPDWWTLGKLYTYHLQTEPFVHLDSDLFLWKRLPARLERADVFAQNCSPVSANSPVYQPERLRCALGPGTGGWLPEEWLWYGHTIKHQRAEACCIVGGNRTDFISRYAAASARLVSEPRNQQILRSFPDKHTLSVLIEEYSLAAFVEYHRASAVLPSESISIEYLLSSRPVPWDIDRAAEAGFSHIIGSLKRNLLVADKLEKTVQRDYPGLYKRCITYLNSL